MQYDSYCWLLNYALMNKVFKIFLFGFFIILLSCNKDVDLNDNNPTLSKRSILLLNSYPVAIDEPSGLCFYRNGTLLTVDDNSNKVFQIDKQGNILREFPFQGNDLEGVAADTTTGKIWVVNEGDRKLIALDSSGTFIKEYHIDIQGSNSNKGLEGLSYDVAGNMFYLVNEGEPKLLVKWNAATEKVVSSKEVSYGEDNSGIFYDASSSALWILSDKSQKLVSTDLNGTLKDEFSLDYDKAEGIVVDEVNKLVYIIRDKNAPERLYVYSLVETTE